MIAPTPTGMSIAVAPLARVILLALVAAMGCDGSGKRRLVVPNCLDPSATLADGAWQELDLAALRAGTESSFCVGKASVNLHYTNQPPDAVVARLAGVIEGKGWTVLAQKPPGGHGGHGTNGSDANGPVQLVDRDYVKGNRWIKLRAMHYPAYEGGPVHAVVGILTGTPPASR